MDLYSFVSQFIYFLLPGVISWTIYCLLKGHREKSDFLTVCYPVALTVIDYTLGNFLLKGFNFLISIFKGTKRFAITPIHILLSDRSQSVSGETFCMACIVAVAMGLLFTWFDQHNILFRISYHMGITKKVDGGEVWDTLFEDDAFTHFFRRKKTAAEQEGERWIYYRDRITNKCYYGCVTDWSDSQTAKEVIMQQVTVTNQDGKTYRMEKVYLARNIGDFTIEFPEGATHAE